jgi:hypothetical protein
MNGAICGPANLQPRRRHTYTTRVQDMMVSLNRYLCVCFLDAFCPVNGSSAGRGCRRFITIYLYIRVEITCPTCVRTSQMPPLPLPPLPHCCVVITVYIFYIHSMVVVVVASMEPSSYNISSRP